MADSRLEFGITLGSIAKAAEMARHAEALGFHYVASGEHMMSRSPSAHALTLLGVAAGATQRIRLLSSIVLLPLHNPVVLSKAATTLDVASGGRLTLGVGVGGEFPGEFEASGVAVQERGARANEALTLLRRLWTEDTVNFDGRFFQLHDVTLRPAPVQRPHPPVWVGGRQEAAMRRAVAFGDGWLPYLYSPERYSQSVDAIARLAWEAGRSLEGFTFALYIHTSIYADGEKAMRVAAANLGSRYVAGDFQRLVGQYCLVGTPEHCVQRLQEYVDAGARMVLFSWACHPEDIPATLETIARDVVPRITIPPVGAGQGSSS
ncbi:MAG: LLM class flavin-dependent oxidoreductase [Chloroflexi bacterium]|nr:LLM class flavin-dependent oxidoreductase [Chloroflexota bacterium]